MRVVALALVLALVASPVAAVWQHTKWGMSPAQAQRATSARTPAAGTARELSINGLSPALIFDYRNGELTFTGALYFGDPEGGLSAVRLKLINPSSDWTKLLAALRQRYGEPASDEGSDADRLVTWITQKEEIRYSHQLVTSPKGIATVNYSARPAAKGL